MNKKNLIILSVVVLLVILLGVFLIVRLSVKPENIVENLLEGANTEIKEQTSNSSTQDNNVTQDNSVTSNNQAQVKIEGLNINSGKNANGGFGVCVVKCGDGICQKTDPDCGKEGNNSLNCICLETPQECPEDCK